MEQFGKELEKLDKNEQYIIDQIVNRLIENPWMGDILRYPFIREKRIRGKRLYYLIYEEWKAVLIVGISDKKTQQTTIDTIIELLPEYKTYVRKLII